MKKPLLFLNAMLMYLLLCGCRFTTGGAAIDRRFIVSAVGFSTDGAVINVSAEAIIINSETPESDPKAEVLSASGTTLAEAFEAISASLARPMLLEHCGVIVIGNGITPAWLDKICDYCFSENRITLSSYMISADDPAALLSGEPESSVAVGYDIMGIIEQNSSSSGIYYDSRYFEIEGLREKGRHVFTLPYFTRGEDGVSLDGLSVFRNDRILGQLDRGDTELYSIMTENFDSGSVRIGSREYNLNLRKAEYGYSDKDKNKITLKLHISGENINDEVCGELEKKLTELESRLKLSYKTDAFGFGDILSERLKDFEKKYEEDYEKFYASSAFSVECIISGGAKNDG